MVMLAPFCQSRKPCLFSNKINKNIVLGLIACVFIFRGCSNGGKLLLFYFIFYFFLHFFFSCQNSKSFMNEGTWPNTMTSGLATRERNQQGERAGVWKRSLLVGESPTFARDRRCLAVAAAVWRKSHCNGKLWRVSFSPSQVGSSSTKQALCWVCMLPLPVASSVDRLGRGYASLPGASTSLALGC